MYRSQIYKPVSGQYNKKISVVITVYNEQDNIMPLANALYTVLDAQPYDYEIIFVDDGSVDDTYKILRRAQTKVRNLTIIRLKRNLGQTPAFSAGFSYATGEYIVSMDGDLQNDPQDIPKLLKAIEGKYDAICGWPQTPPRLWDQTVRLESVQPHPLSHLQGSGP